MQQSIEKHKAMRPNGVRHRVWCAERGEASGIVNDPNDWSDEVGNPRYIVDLIGKVTRVAVETNRIVRGLEG